MSLVKAELGESWGLGKWCSALVDGCVGEGCVGDGYVRDGESEGGGSGEGEGSCEWEGEDVILEGKVEGLETSSIVGN
ncbi:hypothetical protein Tco_0402941, partial [Tanacetum coccineum]